MVKIGIIGATGYTGFELVRTLQRHREVDLAFLVSESQPGSDLADIYPHLKGYGERRLCTLLEAQDIEVDLVFSCRSHKESMAVLPLFYEKGVRIIDLSADFRMDTPAAYEAWYHVEHTAPAMLIEAVYGLPEIYRESIRGARLVGNPGCYPTGAILALLPLLEQEFIDPDSLIIDAKSGVSGAGRKPSLHTHFVEVNENVSAYNIGRAHRHTGEIEQEVSKLAGQRCVVLFTPHLLPINQGILSTVYVALKTDRSTDHLMALYHERYDAEPFVRVADRDLPQTRYVHGTNYCDVAIQRISGTSKAIVLSAIDNLGKGAAGQAVQNMNLMLGFEETEGLV